MIAYVLDPTLNCVKKMEKKKSITVLHQLGYKSELVKSRCLVEPVWMELIKNRVLRLLGSLRGDNCSELSICICENWYLWEINVRRCVSQKVFLILNCSPDCG